MLSTPSIRLVHQPTHHACCKPVHTQDVCVVLELRDATMLMPNLRKMAAVVAAIPKLEAFVAQVMTAALSNHHNIKESLRLNLILVAATKPLTCWHLLQTVL